MAEIFEAVMLICFGLSWPISLIKNIRLKSAKTMNISFTLFIILGYLAGIAAKLVMGQFTYVLAIYVFNLVVVSGNVAVYFINKKYDRVNLRKEGVKYVGQNR